CPGRLTTPMERSPRHPRKSSLRPWHRPRNLPTVAHGFIGTRLCSGHLPELTVGDARPAGVLILALSAGLLASSGGVRAADGEQSVYPATEGDKRTPEQVGLSAEKLKSLAGLVGGRGCVVRHGYLVYTWGDPAKSGDIASAVKPVVSTLLMLAVQQGKIKDVDAKLAAFEPPLPPLNRPPDPATPSP